MSKKWLLPVVLTVGVFVALAVYGDFDATIDEIGDLPVLYLFGALGLASANYLLRFFRWAFYLRVVNASISVVSAAAASVFGSMVFR